MVDNGEQLKRRERAREPRVARHAGEGEVEDFTRAFSALGQLAYGGAQVSASVVDLNTGRPVLAIDDRVVLPTASIGKILLLIEVAARLTAGDPSVHGIIDRSPLDPVRDSGLWRHLQVPALPVADLAALIGATSDNLATNALIDRVGLSAVRARAESLGLRGTALLDVVRNTRGPDDAPQLSVGSTAELSRLFAALARHEAVDAVTSQRVMGWLSLGTDLSMVASAFGLDPLAHRAEDHDTLLVNKTGTDAGVRAEVGALRGASRAVSYAVTVQFSDDSLARRLGVLDAMRAVGTDLLEYVH